MKFSFIFKVMKHTVKKVQQSLRRKFYFHVSVNKLVFGELLNFEFGKFSKIFGIGFKHFIAVLIVLKIIVNDNSIVGNELKKHLNIFEFLLQFFLD